jgi:iron(III) transport system permease protein
MVCSEEPANHQCSTINHQSVTIQRKLIALVVAAFFAVFLFLPLFTVVREGLRPAYLAEVFRNPVYVEGLLNSLWIAIVTTLITAIIALPLAVIYDRYDFRGKKLVTALMLIPLILPPFVGALGFYHIFGQYGALNALLINMGIASPGGGPDWLGGRGKFWVVCLIEALHLFPILYLNVATCLANLDPSLDESARDLGANQWTRWRRITLPMIRPGVFAGGIIVFIWSFTELGTPLMLGYNRVTAVQIFNGVTELESNPTAYSLVVILLVVAAGIYIVSRSLFGRDVASSTPKGATATRARPVRGWRGVAALVPFLIVAALAALPHMAIALASVARDWYGSVLPAAWTTMHFDAALSHPLVVPSIVNSLFFSSLAMVVCVVIGLSVALITERWRPRGWQVFDICAMLPLAVPGIILAFGYLSMATRFDTLRALMDPVRNPTLLLVMAYAMRRLPYVVRAAAAGLQQTPVELESAALDLGASYVTTLRRITVPLVAANLVAGLLFAFSFSMLEVSDSLILAQKAEFYPITRAIYELATILGSGPYIACAFGVWTMAFLGTTIVVATTLLGQKMGAMFRF